MTTPTNDSLLRTPPDKYGDAYQHHLLDQYKLYVETADRVSQRRTAANNHLLTVNVFLVSLYGLFSSFQNDQLWLLVVPAAGILVCFTWYMLILNYRKLNTAKFLVIHELEEHLPAALFDREWELAERGKGKAYTPLTHIEQRIPLIFAVLYIGLGIYALTLAATAPAG